MARKKLTQEAVDRLRPPAQGRIELFDTLQPAFGLRVTARGLRAYFAMGRVRGRLVRKALGRHPDITVAEARAAARRWLELAAQGIDPEEAARQTRAETVDAVIAEFARRYLHQKGLRTAYVVERDLKRELGARFGPRPISQVGRPDIRAMLDEIAERAPVMANRVLGHLRVLFAWAHEERDLVPENPVNGIRPPGAEQSRDRVLTHDEIRRVWAACDPLGWPGGPIVRLLLATGARRDDIGHASWAEIDAEARVLTVPAARFKSGKAHAILLNQLALDVLAICPRIGPSGFVFPSQADTPYDSYGRAKQKLDRLCGVPAWRIHDVRRTVASELARLGTPPQVLSRVLGHAYGGGRGGVLAVYDRYTYDKEARAAVDTWGEEISRIIRIPAVSGRVG